jgi:hypothetical protein
MEELMADVHRVYDIANDAYKVRISGQQEIFTFTGPNADKDSYDKLRVLIMNEQKKDKKSKMVDHAAI